MSIVVALDVGTKRIGVACASINARLARPVATIAAEDAFAQLQKLFSNEQVEAYVVGLPRNASGELTKQSDVSEQFATQLRLHTTAPVHMVDESLTSIAASERMKAAGEQDNSLLDAYAAVIILEDYLATDNTSKGNTHV